MRFSLLIAFAVLAACQPVPKPFSHGGNPPRELLQLADAQGITVLPITDSAGQPLELLTKRMVTALHEQNVPATYGRRSSSSYLLAAVFSTSPAQPALIWTLQTQQGEIVGRVVQPLENGTGEPAELAKHKSFGNTAHALASLIRDDVPDEVVLPPLYVGEVAGAPGDGNTRLRAAIEQLVPRTGLVLAPKATADTLVLTGKVTLDPVRDGAQNVEIAWTVRDPFGAEVGTIAQASPVAAGSLDENWGLLANEAALAGVVGIAEMIRQIDWSRGFQQPPG